MIGLKLSDRQILMSMDHLPQSWHLAWQVKAGWGRREGSARCAEIRESHLPFLASFRRSCRLLVVYKNNPYVVLDARVIDE